MAAPLIGLGLTAVAIGGIVKTALRAIGIGVISFAGGLAMVATLETILRAQVLQSDLPVLHILGIARVDEAFNILIMFMTLRITVSGSRRLGLI
jgi:hypothetical protein